MSLVADFLITTRQAASTLSRVGTTIGALPPEATCPFVINLHELEAAVAQLSQIAGFVGVRASELQRQVAEATASRDAPSAWHRLLGAICLALSAQHRLLGTVCNTECALHLMLAQLC